MTRDEAEQKLKETIVDMPQSVMISTQQIIVAFHNKHGGRSAVAELCKAFDVECLQGDDICGTCATEGMNRAMEAIGAIMHFDEGNAPSTSTFQ